MSVKVGTLYRKSILRGLDGSIINMRDEADGGWIIQNRQIVNQVKYDELLKKEADRQEAARAESKGVAVPQSVIEERANNPSKIKELEEKVIGIENKLDAILLAINGNNKKRRKTA